MFDKLFLFGFVSSFFFCPFQIVLAQVLEQDSLILVQIYSSTNGNEWNNNSEWLTGPIESWNGVGLSNNRVDTLRFSNNNLDGTLPNELGQLDSLKVLDVRNNPALSGNIPVTIPGLTALRFLTLADNGLEGSIPPGLGDLNELTRLRITNNNLSGTLPTALGNLSQLEVLDIAERRITGTIPESIYTLTNLGQFVIGCDSVSGEISNSIGNLTRLTSFALSNTLISGSIPASLSNADGLRIVALDRNQNLEGPIPPGLWGHPNVFLHGIVFNERLSGPIAPEIGLAVRLQQLIINDNRFEGEVPLEITTLDSLEIITIQNNFFTGLPDMTSMEALDVLAVQNNNLTFEDLEPNLVLIDQGTTFIYAPQKPVYDTAFISVRAGSRLVIKGEIGGSANRYQWFKEGEAVDGGANADLTFNDISIQEAGNYSAEITSVIVPGLTINRNPASVQVTVNEPIQFCDPVILEASVADATATYSWSTGDTARSVTITEPGNYSVVIETANYSLEETFVTELGSSDLMAGTDIDFDIFIEDQAVPGDQALLVDGPVQFVNTSLAGSGFQWDFDDGTSTTEIDPLHVFTTPGSYSVQLTAVDDEGCEVIYDRNVEVQELFVTNAITPNNDGNNDQLFIEPFLYPASLRVVNRWGNEVYYRPDYPNDFNGADLSPGVYFYEINIGSIDKKVNGTITIMD